MLEFHKFDLVSLVTVSLCLLGIYILLDRGKDKRFLAWRIFNACLLLAVALQPKIVHYVKDNRPVLAVAADVSESMRLTERTASAQKFLESRREELGRYFRIRSFAFSSVAQEAKNAAQLFRARPGDGTDISGSLSEIKRDIGDDLAGVLLLSDGNNTAPSAQESWARELNVPVFPVLLGSGKKITDAAVVSVKVGDFAFKNTPVDITATISAIGCAGRTLTVKLSVLEPAPRELSTQKLNVASQRETRDAQFTFTPYASGEFRYRIEIEPTGNEATLANNIKTFTLEVVRDKLRVLFLCGQPGPEYAFLRQVLKNDPLIELVSFVILRNPENITLASDEDLALIPFPVNTLFTTDIFNFDILIAEDFTYKRFGFYPEYMSNIRNWVAEKGGGLIMTGGENSFGSGGWFDTPVGGILPVSSENPYGNSLKGLFNAEVENYEHPITTVDDDPSKNAQDWKNAPQLDGCKALKIKPGASLLAKERSGGWAVISAWDCGKGRVAAIGTNSTWRWALQSDTPDFYSRFWQNTVRFAARKTGEKKLHVTFDRPDYFEGQDYRMKARSAEKQASAELEVSLTDPSGKKELMPVRKTGDREWALSGRFDKSGEYQFSSALKVNGLTAYEETRLQSVAPSRILEETMLDNNEAFLAAAADDSGGKLFTKETFSLKEMLPKLKPAAKKEDKGEKPLWDSFWIMALLAASILSELLLRRRKGML